MANDTMRSTKYQSCIARRIQQRTLRKDEVARHAQQLLAVLVVRVTSGTVVTTGDETGQLEAQADGQWSLGDWAVDVGLLQQRAQALGGMDERDAIQASHVLDLTTADGLEGSANSRDLHLVAGLRVGRGEGDLLDLQQVARVAARPEVRAIDHTDCGLHSNRALVGVVDLQAVVRGMLLVGRDQRDSEVRLRTLGGWEGEGSGELVGGVLVVSEAQGIIEVAKRGVNGVRKPELVDANLPRASDQGHVQVRGAGGVDRSAGARLEPRAGSEGQSLSLQPVVAGTARRPFVAKRGRKSGTHQQKGKSDLHDVLYTTHG